MTSNFIADSLEAARAMDPEHDYPPLDIIQDFRIIWKELQDLRTYGASVERAEAEFRVALTQLVLCGVDAGQCDSRLNWRRHQVTLRSRIPVDAGRMEHT